MGSEQTIRHFKETKREEDHDKYGVSAHRVNAKTYNVKLHGTEDSPNRVKIKRVNSPKVL